MKIELKPEIKLTEDGGDIPSDININNEKHRLTVTVSTKNNYTHLDFSSRLALYDFARSLLYEAVFGDSDSVEFYPLTSENKQCIVNGVRLTPNSSRIFINCPVEKK